MSQNNEENHIFLRALANGNADEIKLIFDLENIVNEPLNCKKDTALLYSARFGNLEILELLLKKGACVNKKNVDGETPLLAAVKAGNERNAILLICHGADVDTKDQNGCSVLIAACQKGLESTVHELITKGANVNYRDQSGWTALVWSIFSLKRKSYSIIKKILNSGANVGLKYDSIGTAYDYAKYLYCDEVAQLICEFEDKPEEIISDWEYLKDQMENKWILSRDIANILDKCHSLKALYYILGLKKMSLTDFISQTPEEINELPILNHRKQHLNRMLRKFHLQQWKTECLGLDFVKNVSKQEAGALAQITFLASVARQLAVMTGSIGYIQKNMCLLADSEDSKNVLLVLAETKNTVLLVKDALRELLQTVKLDLVRPADWIHFSPQNKRRKKCAVVAGVVFTLSLVFICWECHKLLPKIITFSK